MDMNASGINKVVNLRHDCEFIFNENVISYPTNYVVLCEINKIVEEGFSYSAGKIRSATVTIGGSTYVLPIPFELDVKEKIRIIIENE